MSGEEINLYALINLVFALIMLLGYVRLTVKQFNELKRPKSQIQAIRNGLFVFLLVTIITLVPSIVYNYYRTLGLEFEAMRNIVTLTSRANTFLNFILITLLYHFKDRLVKDSKEEQI